MIKIGILGCAEIAFRRFLPDEGTYKWGVTTSQSYFPKDNTEIFDTDLAIVDWLTQFSEIKDATYVRGFLGRMLFAGDDGVKKMRVLSGGEKVRVLLSRMMIEASNVLILDEPTNDLDITTLALLEDYLDGFDGIVLTVSHDRYFLDRVVNRIFAFEGGTITQYEGGYTDYQYKSGGEESLQQAGQAQAEEKKVNRSNWKEGQEKKLKMSYKEQREYETIEQDINDLEEKIQRLEEETLACATDFVKLGEITKEKEEAENQLMEKMERWEYLEELAEQIAAGK